MRTDVRLSMLLVAAGCGTSSAPREPVPLAQVERLPPGVIPEPAPAEADRCVGEHGLVVRADDVTIACEGEGLERCAGLLTVRVRNCGGTPVVVSGFSLGDPSGGRVDVELDARVLRRGEAQERAVSVGGRADAFASGEVVTFTLVVRYGPPSAPDRSQAEATVRVDHAPLRGARAACEACRGDWGRHGMSGALGCNCRTADAGAPCRRPQDCEGPCLFERFERAPQPDGSELATPVGRCHDHRQLFGCHARILEGVAPQRVQPGQSLRAPRVCVD